ncbi:MAG: serine/threonine protein kinase [Polyangiaceae bacterium]|nr:serine/threonine protein kinase [Polyangiaceae bacterium]
MGLDATERASDLKTVLKRVAAAPSALSIRATIRPDTFFQAVESRTDGRGAERIGPASELRDLGLVLTAPRGDDETSAPSTIGEYSVVHKLGAGGMGAVYLGAQRSLDRQVAIKTVAIGASGELEQALIREACVLAKLEHPKIPPVHALGLTSDGRPVLVMKRVQGTSWGAMIDNDDHEAWAHSMLPADRQEAHTRIAILLSEAVAFAHEHGFVHRDIKPDNVMIGQHGEVYLVDWGIAARTGDVDGRLLGTPCFMAPEMFRGDEVKPTMDVYLLGASLYWALTKQSVHSGASFVEIVSNAITQEPILEFGAEVPYAIRSVIADALRRDPSARPASATEFRARLEAHFRHRASTTICDAALARLEILRSKKLLDTVEERRLATECRFGFLEALRDWPENAAAREGLVACARSMVELEIERGNVDAARSWLSELAPEGTSDAEARRAAAALSERVDELARRLERDRSEHARLVSFEREINPAVAARATRKLLGVLTVAAVVLGAFTLTFNRTPTHAPVRWTFVVSEVFVFATVVGAGFLIRRNLGQNKLARNLHIATGGTILFLLVRRVLAVTSGELLHAAIREDLLILSVVTFVGGVLAQRMWLVGSAALMVSALVAHFVPDLARVSGNLGPPLALVAVLVYSVVESRRTV